MKKPRRKKKVEPWFDPAELRASLRLTPEARLRALEELNRFLLAFTPKANRKIWEEMKGRGW